MTPLVSVVMSCYNSANSVTSALQSITEQSLRDIEIIVVNDGSTDSTLDIIEDMARSDDRIHIINNQENIGLSASLNRGIRAAQSALIARMDADDWATPDRLQIQYDFMTAHPDVDICGSGMAMYHDDRHLRDVYLPERHEDIVRRVFSKPLLYHPTIMIKKEVYCTHGSYDPHLRWAEDADLWYRIYDKVRLHNLPLPLLHYQLKPRLSARMYRKNLQVKYTNLQRRGKVLTHLPELCRDAIIMMARMIKNY